MKKLFKYLLLLLFVSILLLFIINTYVKVSTRKQFISLEEYQNLDNIDCIVVLGASIWNEKPSPMLQDRLDTSINLYNLKKHKIIMSGDHSTDDYDEVNPMKNYALEKEIPSSDIFNDHYGISTYDSLYRAKFIFNAKKIVIVTQKYHLYRALHIAKKLDIEAYGISTPSKKYTGDAFRELREILARNKDFLKSIIKPKSKYITKIVSLNQSGDVTNEKD